MMTQLKDNLDLHYSVSQEKPLHTFNRSLESYLGSRADIMEILDTLNKEDADMPMGICLKAYLLKLASDPRFDGPVTQSVSRLKQLKLNPREQMHAKTLELWANHQMTEATKCLEDLLQEYPRDMLALRVAHYMHFYSGNAQSMCDSIDRVFDAWSDGDPYYGYLLGMKAFALEEAGDYHQSEEFGRRAIDYHSEDIWAAHAVAHVFQTQNRFGEGIEWIEQLSPQWKETNNFQYHLYWHKALFHIGRSETKEALEIYDRQLKNIIADDFYLDVCNAAALLWRLVLLDVDVGDRWQDIEEVSRRRMMDKELVFATLHYLMSPAILRDPINQGIESLRQWADNDSTQGKICKEVGLPLAEALVMVGTRDFENAAEALDSLSPQIYKIGGSHAQRHLFTLIEEYCQSR